MQMHQHIRFYKSPGPHLVPRFIFSDLRFLRHLFLFLNRLQNLFSLLVSFLCLSLFPLKKVQVVQQPTTTPLLWLQTLVSLAWIRSSQSRSLLCCRRSSIVLHPHVALSSPLPLPFPLSVPRLDHLCLILLHSSLSLGRTSPSSGWVEIILWIKEEEGASLSSSSSFFPSLLSVCLSIQLILRHILLQKDLVPCLFPLFCSFEESLWWHKDKRTKPETGTDHLPFVSVCFWAVEFLSFAAPEQRLQSQRWLHGSGWYVSVLWNEWICEKQMGQFANPKNGVLFPFNSVLPFTFSLFDRR